MIEGKITKVNIQKKNLVRKYLPLSNQLPRPRIKKIHPTTQIILQNPNLLKNHQVIPNNLLHMKKIPIFNIPINLKNLNYMLSLKIILIKKKSSENSIRTFQIAIVARD